MKRRPTVAARIALLLAGAVWWAVVPTAAVWAEARNPAGVAVIIGNQTYQHGPEVSFAVRDAAAFKHYVIEVLGFDESNIIELHDASQADMESAFGNERSHKGLLWRYLNPTGGSDVVVYYSGHGVPSLEDKRGYLLPTDAHPDTAQINGYPIDLLYANLGRLEETRTVAVYLDACFSGDSHGGPLIKGSVAWVQASLPAGAGMTVLTAASGVEVASWDETAQHGLFTHHLLDALYGNGDGDGNGQVTAAEVADYLKRHMTRAARRRFGREQTATLIGPPGAVLAVTGVATRPSVPLVVGGRQIERDKLMHGITRAHEGGDHARVLKLVADLKELGGELPPQAGYYEGLAYQHLRRYREARAALTRYAEQIGSESKPYQEVLDELLHLDEVLEKEDAVYEQALAGGTAAAFEHYLDTYPHGRYAAKAGELLATARAEEQERGRQLDDDAFTQAQAADTAAAYRTYLADYPNGRHAAQARQLRDAALARVRDDAAFARAQQADTAAAYAGYLATYPDGRHARAARRLRAAADDAAFGRAQVQDTAAAYAAYLDAYPAGRYAAQARRLRTAALRREQERPGQVLRDCPECPQLIVVPGGVYLMGSPTTEQGRNDDEGPRHRVTIGEPFAVGIYEVTRREFGEFVRQTNHAAGNSCWMWSGDGWENESGRSWMDPGFRQRDDHPVTCVSWHDAQAYVAWLSRHTGNRYRLPSESEWEYVARAGVTSARYWGQSADRQCRNANGADESSGLSWATSCDDGHRYTAPTGSFTANPYGLYDVLGNVWEWTRDCWNGSYTGAPTDGSAWERGECSRRVVRGGSWYFIPEFLRSAIRFGSTTGGRFNSLGFRVARTLTS